MNSRKKIGAYRLAKTLELTDKLGFITINQLVIYFYNQESASAKASIARMLKNNSHQKGLFIQRDGPNNLHYFVLSAKGAKQLFDDTGHKAKSGKDVIYSAHRQAANLLAISLLKKGLQVWTDADIARNLCPANFYAVFGDRVKKPDVLSIEINAQGMKRAYWYEVENSRRGQRDLENICNWLAMTRYGDDAIEIMPNVYLETLVMVSTKPQYDNIDVRMEYCLRKRYKTTDDIKNISDAVLFIKHDYAIADGLPSMRQY